MGCCGQRRSQPIGETAAPPGTHSAWPASPLPNVPGHRGYGNFAAKINRVATSADGVVLRYREIARVQVRGPVTGRTYEFSAAQPAQVIEPRDADLLLRTGHFLRV